MLRFSAYRPRIASACVLAALALAGPACGGDDSAADAEGGGPERVLPPGPLYAVGGVVTPDGRQRADLDALIGRFAKGQSLDSLLAQLKDDQVSYEKDIKPWLGKRYAAAFTALDPKGDDAKGVGAVEVTDEDEAQRFLEKQAPKGRTGSYEGVDFREVSEPDVVVGLTQGELVLGTEPEFRAAIDRLKGDGRSILDDPAFAAQRRQAQDALLYQSIDYGRFFDVIGASEGDSTSEIAAVKRLFQGIGLAKIFFSAQARADGLQVDYLGEAGERPDTAGAELLRGLPGGVLAAGAVDDLGARGAVLLDLIQDAQRLTPDTIKPGNDVRKELAKLERRSGVSVQDDVLANLGAAGGFVQLKGLSKGRGALVVVVDDAGAVGKAVRALARAADLEPTDVPDTKLAYTFPTDDEPGWLALTDDRLVVATDRTALDRALEPDSELGDDPAFQRAERSLGDGMRASLYLDVPSLVAGIKAMGTGGDADLAQALPYLEQLGPAAVGQGTVGGVADSRVVVGLG